MYKNINENPHIIYEKRDQVAYITINRPEVLNALDLRTHKELALVWDMFEQDDSIRVGVLTGSGNRAFSVGQDLKELVEQNSNGPLHSTFGSKGRVGWPRLTERLSLSKPLIARIDGYALGGGFELALACDILVASENSEFALPEAKLGLIAGAGGIFRLPRQIPLKIAMGYLMTGRHLSAARGFELGLVNEVVPAKELDACVDSWVKDILRCAPLSVRAIKEAVMKSMSLSLEDAFTASYEWEECRAQSCDSQEGPLAFIEQRLPKWSGT